MILPLKGTPEVPRDQESAVKLIQMRIPDGINRIPNAKPLNPQEDNLIGLPGFVLGSVHFSPHDEATDQKLITFRPEKRTPKLLMISLAIHFPSNFPGSILGSVQDGDRMRSGFRTTTAGSPPAIIIIRMSFIFPIRIDIIIFIFLSASLQLVPNNGQRNERRRPSLSLSLGGLQEESRHHHVTQKR